MSDLSTPAAQGRGSGEIGGSRDPAATHGDAHVSPIPVNLDHVVTHAVRVDPSRSMKAVTENVEELLDDSGESRRRNGALLASELIAQVVDPATGWNRQEVQLTVQLRADAVRLEARGPALKTAETPTDRHVVSDPVADWGPFLIDSLADRWGLDGGSRRLIWAEIDTSA
jgi:hypothetical protein